MTKKILIVEDSPRVAAALEVRLKSAGFGVLRAKEGAEGLKMALQHKPDLVLLDMWLPVGLGVSVATRLKELAPEIPFIFMTACRKTSMVKAANKLGAAGFFNKPFRWEDLLETIEGVLGKGQSGEIATRPPDTNQTPRAQAA